MNSVRTQLSCSRSQHLIQEEYSHCLDQLCFTLEWHLPLGRTACEYCPHSLWEKKKPKQTDFNITSPPKKTPTSKQKTRYWVKGITTSYVVTAFFWQSFLPDRTSSTETTESLNFPVCHDFLSYIYSSCSFSISPSHSLNQLSTGFCSKLERGHERWRGYMWWKESLHIFKRHIHDKLKK